MSGGENLVYSVTVWQIWHWETIWKGMFSVKGFVGAAQLSISSVSLKTSSSPLVASICSVWSSVWLCLGNWWGLLFGSSGTAAGCLSWEVWWLRTGSMGLAILLSAKSCCGLLWEQRLHPLHPLGPVLLGCYRLQLTSLSSVIVLQFHFSAKDGVVILCVCLRTVQYWWIFIGLVVVQLRAVHRFSIYCSSLRYFPERSWTVVAFPCFDAVQSDVDHKTKTIKIKQKIFCSKNVFWYHAEFKERVH